MKKNITQPLLNWDAHSVAILDMARLNLKFTTLEELENAQTHLLSDYAPNTTEETLECMA